jgi:hypothetical protein
MFQGTPSKRPVSNSDEELDVHLHVLAIDLAIADSRIERPSVTRKRSRKLFRGIALIAGGLLFSGSTGGLTLILCAVGVVDVIDVLEEDTASVKLRAELRGDLERYTGLCGRLAAEKARRRGRFV